jgi:hypothetical protein
MLAMVGEGDISTCTASEVLMISGHKNVRATHKTTLEFTKEDYLTERGDCIVGISATKALKDFNTSFKELARRSTSVVITMILTPNGIYDVIVGRGDERLTYEDDVRIIIRRSDYVCRATAAVRSDKAAIDLKRDLINYLRFEGSKALVIMLVLDLNCFWSLPLPPNFP